MSEAQTSERTALKEWSILVDAMARGDIIAMVRKGGIREQRAGFSVRHSRFLLYPTFFHEKAHEVAPRFREELARLGAQRPDEGTIRIAHVADVLAVWTVTELDRLRAIESDHGLAWAAVESRFHYRDNPVVQVVAVKVSTLPQVAVVPELRRYQGCVSWVNLDEPIDVSGASSVISETDLQKRLERLERTLGDSTRLAPD